MWCFVFFFLVNKFMSLENKRLPVKKAAAQFLNNAWGKSCMHFNVLTLIFLEFRTFNVVETIFLNVVRYSYCTKFVF